MRNNDWRPEYDEMLIENYKKKHPKEIEKLEIEFKNKYPKLNKKTLKRLVDNHILPPVLERPEVDDVWGGKDVLSLDGIPEKKVQYKLV